MLWQRVLTALVLAPLVIAAILWLDSSLFSLILGGVVLLGAYEMGRLANLDRVPALAAFVVAVGVSLWLIAQFLQPVHRMPVQGLMAAWWVLITLSLLARRRDLERVSQRRPAILLLGGLVLVVAWWSVVGLHASGPQGPPLVLFLFILIWVADSGAYFAGRAFGKRKLSPFVSPGKTWAGAYGALAGAVVSAALLMVAGYAGQATPIPLILLCLLVTLVSIGGDLWESRLKREAGVKDSGSLLPGHGGVLDRVDSLLAAAPVFALGAGLIGVTA